MSDSPPDATCSDCGARRSQEPGPCPECGSRNRTIGVGTAAELDAAGPVGVAKGVAVGLATTGRATARRVREWLDVSWPALLGGAGLTVFGYLIRGDVGLVLGVAATAIGAEAFARVREIERR